ncbi:hypothetical protein ACIU4M_12130 [Bacillus altitudinis]|uniref:hypothetical protein n=1 Tax=Bacillus altitudinis TaxID=293387 RepID=UPI0022811CA1|nr:hypothetical protein [Bacillus altitudinis]MCY7692734.1 hypothetical protein [Bacillus altitudinis]MDH3107637.1 hypothetical protein [Bacillus altitudinis]
MIDINKILFYFLWVMFYLVVVIKKTMAFIFIPSKNSSVRLIQLMIWGISVSIILLLFHVSMEVFEVMIFLLYNLIYLSVNYWVLTFVFYLNSRNDPIYIKNLKSNDFLHEIPKTNDIILEIQKIKESINDWAEKDKKQDIARLKLLRIFDKVSSDKKRFNFFSNSIVTLILGLTTSVILNKDVIKYLDNTHGATSIDKSFINLTNGVTLLLLGLMYASKFLVLGHRINKKNELYEELLNDLILEKIEEKKIETENTSSSNN